MKWNSNALERSRIDLSVLWALLSSVLNLISEVISMNYQVTTINEVLTQLEGNTRSSWATHIDTERMLNEFKAYEFNMEAYFEERAESINEDIQYDIDRGAIEEGVLPFVEAETFEDAYDMMEYLELVEGWKEVTHDNTYNWNAPLYNHIDFHVYKDDMDYYYVFAKMHISGDVRGNYTDYFVLRFDNEYGCVETMLCYSEGLDEMIGDWSVTMEVSNECFQFYNHETHDDFEACCSDMDEIKAAIAEYEKE